MGREEKAAVCMLHSVKGVGHGRLMRIKEEFGSCLSFPQLSASKLRQASLPPPILDEIIALRKGTHPLSFLEKLEKRDIGVVTIEEKSYPQALRYISQPPVILYYRGQIGGVNDFSLAVVGSRAATPYGKHTARKLGQALAQHQVTVVSGMARGVDREAHLGALEGQGFTIGVLGNGIDVVYPRENKPLYDRVAREGLIISEFPPATSPEARNFPMRNRLISGLAQGVVVVEAGLKSGALITVDFALEQGKDVFAVPGPINSPASAGANKLIQQGAIVYTEISDIIQEYAHLAQDPGPKLIKQEELFLPDKEESVIMENMSWEPCHFDTLLDKTGFDFGHLSILLLNLELKGIVQALPGNYYVKL
jgi:DNA processing protein